MGVTQMTVVRNNLFGEGKLAEQGSNRADLPREATIIGTQAASIGV